MSTEIVVPFALSPSGSIAVTTNPNTQVQQHVDSLVSTTPGERVMNPDYGVDLTGQVFHPNAPEIAAQIENDVALALGTWEPTVEVQKVQLAPGVNEATGQISVEVDYSYGTSTSSVSATVQTATVLPGGTVVQDVTV